MRKWLIILLVMFCLAVFLNSLMRAFSRDLAPPDYTEFAFERAVVDPASNADTAVSAAIELLDLSDDDHQVLADFLQDKPVNENSIADLLARNQAVFDKLREAMALEVYEPPVVDLDEHFPAVRSLLTVSRLLTAKSQAHRLAGNPAGAIDDCITLLRLSGFVKGSPNSLIEYLVGLASTGMGIAEAQTLIREATLSTEDLVRLVATLEAVDTLEADLKRALKAEAQLMPTLLRGAIQEFRDLLDLFPGLPEWVPPIPMGWASGYFLHPNRTAHQIVAMYRGMIRNARLPYSARDHFDLGTHGASDRSFRMIMTALKPNALGRLVLESHATLDENLLSRKSRVEAALRGTLLTAALRAHEQRTGALPLDLAELVPESLAAVPLDPLDGEPFRYCRERRIVYSVGINLTDFGGTRAESKRTRGPTYQDPGAMDDIVFDLHPGE